MDSNSEDIDAKDAGATTPCGLPAAMDSALAPTATLTVKLRSRPNPKYGPGARTQRQTSHVLMDSNSEDVNTMDVGAKTPCGLLAAMDSAPALTATSPMNLI